MMMDLCYRTHGGSGFNITYSDVLGMELPDMSRWVTELYRRRKEEARAMREADAKRRGVRLVT